MKCDNRTERQLISKLDEQLPREPESPRKRPIIRDNHAFASRGAKKITAQASAYGRSVPGPPQYHITDLIDLPLLQQLLNAFYELTGIRHAVLDAESNILSSTGWNEICTDFHRVCPRTEQRCIESDSYVSRHLDEGLSYVGYKCLNGLMEYATPIIADGQYLGSIYMGQLLHEPPDGEFFINQAREFGFEEESYLEAVRKVNIAPEKRIKPIMEFYAKLGRVLSQMGLEKKKQLEAAEDKFSKAFNCFPDPVSITDINTGCYADINDAWVQTTGYEINEVIGRSPLDFGLYQNPENRRLILNKLQASGYVRNYEVDLRMKSGEVRTFLTSADIITIANRSHMLSIYKDITERKKAEEEVKFLSFHDKLTGLYNRAYFEEALRNIATEKHLPISLIIVDVNGLKLINDALGHLEGDRFLKKVAEILKKFCYQGDIAARWGGDEFIALLPDCDSNDASRISEKIKKACKHISHLPIETTLSVGHATLDSNNQDLTVIMKIAEDRMYRNKLLENRSARSSFLTSLQKTLWTRSHETQEHCQRMQSMAQNVGQAIMLSDAELDNLKLLAVLHDIGKIAVPNSILDKPGKLSSDEWDSIKKHTEVGYRIALSLPEMAPIAEAILYHHERWDGGGYPLGLTGEEIPLISRIIAIIDAYDVMLYGRPYQEAVRQDTALDEIKRCAGSQFDPDLVKKAIGVLVKK